MYAVGTDSSVVAVSGFGSLVHPGEDASAKEEDDWWRSAEAIIAGTDAAYFTVNLPPPRLKHLQPTDLSEYSVVTVPAATESNYLQCIEHNRKVRLAKDDNDRRDEQLRGISREADE